ncbi:MAG: hypothetical protein COW24_01375 [Candidatus Kerfeldbacteria bacterium CG15_BIG_FIL_POST_REV_8_21_14_020_45_12]|uniref:Purine nucleoside phosphorylase n=1 Tax=Candidatus Kerfeldbacteria bacterium CG15_BIG_FIL_POST_REV_8_21_14_020_45_12 TaxID=2014247 RepID=A0A2M7H4Q7_9BACT|nr:MAG: hypothetical protein COW24_01375 [Candidatus Kerfeldbacteria bacterium CG15_BIG_FIL_POST_REV_8_21_14_020_45_12]PJA93373.1 MAG: hypothetical protein CO132_03385 [Candidatus Kerfeldbacteria bacterium CG_4_9_14_3_um_filter_45_8]
MIRFNNLSALAGVDHGITEKGDEAPAGLVRGQQTHGNGFAWIENTNKLIVPKVDALATRAAGLTLGVYTADCVSILFADERSGVVGTIHAGWRGTALDITRQAIESLKIHPNNLKVGIGPAICLNCFEVGEEVAKQFDAAHVRPSEEAEGKYFIDLWQANVDLALEAGVKQSNIEVIRRCTLEDDALYSFRQGDRDDRQVSWIVRNE